MFNDYFADLFHTSSQSGEAIEKGTTSVQRKVTNEMNLQLQKHFTRDKIQEAMKQMAYLKSPSPEDFSACFY